MTILPNEKRPYFKLFKDSPSPAMILQGKSRGACHMKKAGIDPLSIAGMCNSSHLLFLQLKAGDVEGRAQPVVDTQLRRQADVSMIVHL